MAVLYVTMGILLFLGALFLALGILYSSATRYGRWK